MLGEDRQNSILSLLNERGSITTTELMNELDASESTIRRDLNFLDAEGLLVKVHGGAIAKDRGYYTVDSLVSVRSGLNIEDKQKIAKYAAELIEEGDLVYIDAGTTTELMIDFIKVKNVTFVTNSINHAKKLTKCGYTTYVLGGEFKYLTEAIVGEEAIMGLDKYNFTKGFFGTNGITLKNGFSTPDPKEAMVKQKSMQKTKTKYVLCDSSKFSQISSVTFAAFDSATIITTNIKDSNYKNKKNIVEVN